MNDFTSVLSAARTLEHALENEKTAAAALTSLEVQIAKAQSTLSAAVIKRNEAEASLKAATRGL